jgi:hypothetical protein
VSKQVPALHQAIQLRQSLFLRASQLTSRPASRLLLLNSLMGKVLHTPAPYMASTFRKKIEYWIFAYDFADAHCDVCSYDYLVIF